MSIEIHYSYTLTHLKQALSKNTTVVDPIGFQVHLEIWIIL